MIVHWWSYIYNSCVRESRSYQKLFVSLLLHIFSSQNRVLLHLLRNDLVLEWLYRGNSRIIPIRILLPILTHHEMLPHIADQDVSLNLGTYEVVGLLIRTNLIMPCILWVHFAVVDMLEQLGRLHEMPSIKGTNSVANNLRLHRKVELLGGLLLDGRLLHFRRLLLCDWTITRLACSFLLLRRFIHV